ncbi:MAG: uracil-DNA glycosylase [Thiobacillus sp.]|jgi:hypothetical protein
MGNLELAKQLVSTLPSGIPGLFNPWTDRCPDDLDANGPDEKLARLSAHLDCDPRFILCGEAIGFAGGRHSGVAFTSERLLLLEGLIPRLDTPTQRLTSRNLPFSEPSATIVWKALHRLGIAEHTILWNAVQLHPYKPGNIRSNRTPTGSEVALGAKALRGLLEAFPRAKVVAVGRKAEDLLKVMAVRPTGCVRHPANGGATAFAAGLAELAV